MKTFGEDGGQISVLTLAWAYVLSARWSEIIPGAAAIEYTDNLAVLSECSDTSVESEEPVIDLGVATDEAVRCGGSGSSP